MGFFILFLQAASVSAIVCAIICITLLRGFGWKNSSRYWVVTCGFVPAILIAIAIISGISFSPPTPEESKEIANGKLVDPGPLNFAVIIAFGVVYPISYMISAIPVSILMKRKFAKK